MAVSWEKDPASRSDSRFIGVDRHSVRLIAAPGESISFRLEQALKAIEPSSDGWRGRWRMAVWNRASPSAWPLIDSDFPSAVRDIDVVEALGLLGLKFRESIWACLWDKFECVRGMGRPVEGYTPPDELRRAVEAETELLRGELERGFPDRWRRFCEELERGFPDRW